MSTTAIHPASIPVCEGLQQACADAQQTRRRYLLAAERCEQAGLFVVAHAFRFTAAQEGEHASALLGLLRAGGADPLPDPAPAILPDVAPLLLLQECAEAEQAQADALHACALAAAQNGCPRMAGALERIAETEHLHAMRFAQYADALASGTLYRSEQRTSWFCLRCGQMHYGLCAPQVCSTCGRGGGAFIRTSFHPFAVRS